ncbi:hypothetical protein BDR04DRAFT_1232812 [Suillus decipiens]|nr:hypothetical protein BDR04DRAFT_1232812 [Suillus decipiens]
MPTLQERSLFRGQVPAPDYIIIVLSLEIKKYVVLATFAKTAWRFRDLKLCRKSNGVVPPADAPDSNATILGYKSLKDKKRDRKERLVRESESKVSRQKRKRLEKKKRRETCDFWEASVCQALRFYRRIFTEVCRQTQAQTSSLDLQSSSTLGTGATSTARERQEKLEDKEVRRAMEGQLNKRRQRLNDFTIHEHGYGEGESDAMDGVGFVDHKTPEQHEGPVMKEFFADPPTASVVS